ncbi:MAG: allantoinase [Terriglobales bacterium]
MANLTLVYGLRLLPSDEVAEVTSATVKLKNGREAHVAMHIIEGGKNEIEKQLKMSLSAFFDIYPEI